MIFMTQSLNNPIHYDVPDKSKGIIYRNFKPGDEFGLANTFNFGFQQNGAFQAKTAHNFHWRYIDFPGYEPRQINVAEDEDTGEIVGCVMGAPQDYLFGGKSFTFGLINDVTTVPGYGGRGIAKNLMKMALNYFQDKNMDFSSLSADPHGFPRAKIYCPLGYEDNCNTNTLVHFTSYKMLARRMPIMIPFLPALSVLWIPAFIPYLKYRSSFRKTPFKISEPKEIIAGVDSEADQNDGSVNSDIDKKIQDYLDSLSTGRYTVEILHYKGTEEFRVRMNEICSNQFEGYHPYSREEWIWSRKGSSRMYKSSHIAIRDSKTDKIIAGSIITSHNEYINMIGAKMRTGTFKNLFLDEPHITAELGIKTAKVSNDSALNSRTEVIGKSIGEMYKILFLGTIKASLYRKNCITLMMNTKKFRNMWWAGMSVGFRGFMGGVHMVKPLKIGLKYPGTAKKPLYLDVAEEFGTY
jgi:ribosomal protein S18 acetylase RimI-like enzyme